MRSIKQEFVITYLLITCLCYDKINGQTDVTVETKDSTDTTNTSPTATNTTGTDICSVTNARISCNADSISDLSPLFQSLSTRLPAGMKQIRVLQIFHTNITVISDTTFRDIKFEAIVLKNVKHLTAIGSEAFAGMATIVKRFHINDSPHYQHQTPQTFFNMLNKFINIENIVLRNINMVEIPAKAFGELTKLKQLDISGPKIKTVGEGAFASLSGLKSLFIHETNIKTFGQNVLVFSTNPTLELKLSLRNRLVTANPATGFPEESLSRVGRPTHLILYGVKARKQRTKWTHLDEKTFKPFLAGNDKNHMTIALITVDITGADSAWITDQFKARINITSSK